MYRMPVHYEILMPDKPSTVMFACESFHKDLDSAFIGMHAPLRVSPAKNLANEKSSCSVSSSKGKVSIDQQMVPNEKMSNNWKSNKGISDFEIRQEDLLSQLRSLNTRLDALKGKPGNNKKRGSDQAKDVKRQKTESISQEIPDVPIPKPTAFVDGNFATYGAINVTGNFKKRFPLNIFVNADAPFPVLLLGLACLIRERVGKAHTVGVKAFLHSSLVASGNHNSLADKIKCFNLVAENDGRSDQCELMMNFVWKKDLSLKEPILFYGACLESRTSKIVGELPIAKYLASLTDFYPVVGSSPEAAFLTMDYWILTLSSFVRPGFPAIRKSILKELNSVLVKRQFLIGDRITFADLVTWSILNQTGYNFKRLWDSMPSNVQKWFGTMNSVKTFKSVIAFLYCDIGNKP